MTSPPSSVLFDKGVIRRVYERRVRLSLGRPPTLLQVEAANAHARMSVVASRLHITEQTASVLRVRTRVFAAPLLASHEPLRKGRYLRRWARRLRDFGFSPEDAVVLAYGSFGVAESAGKVGVDLMVTTDISLSSRYGENLVDIGRRFRDMVADLSGRYADLTLPRVVTTSAVLREY